jgi:small subunit ribosomal protein S3
MGQKINPIAFRLGVNKGWDSVWFAKKKEFGRYLIEDFKIRKYIQKNILNSGVSDIIIERSGKKLIVSIHTSRPGFVIGKKGADIEKIKSNVLGALGIKVMVSGRLSGIEIARTEWEREGSIPSHTLRANIDYGTAEALTTYGIIGIKVWIYKGQLFEKDVDQEKKERVKNRNVTAS